MLSLIGHCVQKFSLIGRLCFAANRLPEELPRYWEEVASFANCGSSSQSLVEKQVTAKDAQLCVENLIELDSGVFDNDIKLFSELCQWSTLANKPLGCVLISKNTICKVFGDQLLIKSRDSIRKIVVYDDVHGTHIGCHYIKFCRTFTCKFRQYYGKHTTDGVELYYDQDWMDNDFFLSTQQTAFPLRFLKNFDSELLIGQISYNQKANIYNTIHGYNSRLMKTRSEKKGDREQEIDTADVDLKRDKR